MIEQVTHVVAGADRVTIDDVSGTQTLSVILSSADGGLAMAAQLAVGTREQVRDAIRILRRQAAPQNY